MSYLNLENGVANFAKAVISFWFRVPQASIAACIANRSTAGVQHDIPPLDLIIPLLTFGKEQMWDETQFTFGIISHYNYDTTPEDGALHGQPVTSGITGVESLGQWPLNPSHIGLLCNANNGKAYLQINLQMSNPAIISEFFRVTTRIEYYRDVPDPAFPDVGIYRTETYTTDLSTEMMHDPQTFTVQSNDEVEGDKWHHLLLSFDLSTSVHTHGIPYEAGPRTEADGTDSYCRLFYALDDVNLSGFDNMSPSFPFGHSDSNAILPDDALTVAGAGYPLSQGQNATCVWEARPIPSNDAELGLPSSTKYVDSIYRVELAEFQFFAGVTLDTSIESNRRAFISASGEPVDPTEGSTDDPRPLAEQLLGKKPDILLHGSDDWERGLNTGTTGIEIDAEGNIIEIPAGQFQPIARIEPYKPEPKLGI